MGIGCRFYEHRYPEVEDVVMVNVREIQDMGAYVRLSEYNDIEGMILLSELSRRRIRSINKLIRVGRSECVVVIRVDKDKGYIDLSKRRVSPEEVVKCEEKYAKGKCIHSILCHVGSILNYETDEELEELYHKSAWHFDRKYGKTGACFEAFKQAVTNPEILDECDLDDHTKSTLIENIRRRLTPQAVKIRSDLEVACYDYEGVDAVKRALRKGLELSTEDMPIKINLIAPPVYVLSLQTLERADGVKRLEEAIEKIKGSILEENGVFNVKMAPKVVSAAEETEFAKELEKLEKQNQEIGGDSSEDSYSDGDGSDESGGEDGGEGVEPED